MEGYSPKLLRSSRGIPTGSTTLPSLSSSGNTSLDISSINDLNNMSSSTTEFKMPIYRLVSPRTRRKINLLPTPNKEEMRQIEQLEQQARAQPLTLTSRRGLYNALHTTQARQETSGEDTEQDAGILLLEMREEVQKIMETQRLRLEEEKLNISGGRTYSPPSAHIRQASSAYLDYNTEETKEVPIETPRADWQELELYNEGHKDRLGGRIAHLQADFLKTKKVSKIRT